MGAPMIKAILPGSALTVVQAPPKWGVIAPPAHSAKKMSGVGMGVFAMVLAIHMGVFALLSTRAMTIATEPSTPGQGPLRVRLVSSKPEQAPQQPQPVVQPPPPPQSLPKPEKKVLSTEAPSQRVVEAAKPQPEPAPASPVPQPVAAPQAVPTWTVSDAPAAPAAAAPKQETLDLGGAPKQVGQIDCRVPKPDYPRAARRRGAVGTVTLRLTVDERGQVSAAIEQSSGFPDLDALARQAGQSAQCKPYLEGGRPVRVTALQPIHFVPAD